MADNNNENTRLRLAQIGIPTEFLPLFLEKGTVHKVDRNEILVNIGEKCHNIYIVLKGGFVSQQTGRNGTLRTINFFLENYQPYMSSFHSIFKAEKSRIQLMAIKKSTVLVFEKSDIEKLNEKHITLKDFFIKRLVDALLIENEFKSHLIASSSLEFYKQIIENYPELVKNVPAKYIAQFMGISRVWLSNIKRKNFRI